MSAPSELTPAIPPRPTRSKTPVEADATAEAPSAPGVPSIPPRPSRRPEKTPTAASEETATPEPSIATISPSVELQQPIPVSTIKPDAEELRKQTTATPSEATDSRAISRAESRSTSSLGNYESGIPRIGSRVPLEPNAGDVQAPTPTGTKVIKNATKDVYKDENYGEYGKAGSVERIERNNLARSAVELNESVQKALTGSGVGTRPDAQPVPDEDVAYLASDDFTSRMLSPEPDAKTERSVYDRDVISIDPNDARRSHAATPHHASRPHSRAHSRLGERLEDPEEFLDETTGTPILASDEIHKSKSSPGTPYVPRAMSPALVEPSEAKEESPVRSTPPAATPESDEEVEKNSLGGGYTPLKKDEDLEPLFPDEEDEAETNEADKPASAARPSLKVLGREKSRFPSQDVWEDAPESSTLETVVSDPGETRKTGEEEQDEESSRLPVVPRRGHSRRPSAEGVQPSVGYPHEAHEEAYPQDGRSKDRIPVAHKSHVSIPQSSLRADAAKATSAKSKQRFPSADVWEDAPDSQYLSATVTPGQPEQQDDEPPSPVENQKSPIQAVSPSEPAKREPSPEKPKQRPPPPTKPKPPVIPPRPGKKPVPPPVPAEKPKPAVPPKQPGKLLNSAFLGALNSRLAAGPGAVLGLKKEEKSPETEEPARQEEPLADIRKSRAKGPRGRKPPTAPTASILKESSSSQERPKYVGVWTIYEADENGEPIPGTGITKSMTLSEIEKVLADKTRKQVDFVLPEAKAEKTEAEKPSEVSVEEAPKEEKEVVKTEEPTEESKEKVMEEPKVEKEPEPTEPAAPLTTDAPEHEVQEKTNTVVEQAEEKIKEVEAAQESAAVVESEPTKKDVEAVQDEALATETSETESAPAREEARAVAESLTPAKPVEEPAKEEKTEAPVAPAGEESKALGEEKELGQGGRQDEPEEEKKALVEAAVGPGAEGETGKKREDAQ